MKLVLSAFFCYDLFMPKAPDFTLPDQTGITRSLSDFKGKWLLVYFYPKDDTPGCTTEACSVRDNFEEFKKHGLSVVGISKDSVASHKKFAEKYHLNFPILSDPNHEVIEAYGAWHPKKFAGKEFLGTHRESFLVDPNGEIKKVYKNVNPATHVEEILKDFALLL